MSVLFWIVWQSETALSNNDQKWKNKKKHSACVLQSSIIYKRQAAPACTLSNVIKSWRRRTTTLWTPLGKLHLFTPFLFSFSFTHTGTKYPHLYRHALIVVERWVMGLHSTAPQAVGVRFTYVRAGLQPAILRFPSQVPPHLAHSHSDLSRVLLPWGITLRKYLWLYRIHTLPFCYSLSGWYI